MGLPSTVSRYSAFAEVGISVMSQPSIVSRIEIALCISVSFIPFSVQPEPSPTTLTIQPLSVAILVLLTLAFWATSLKSSRPPMSLLSSSGRFSRSERYILSSEQAFNSVPFTDTYLRLSAEENSIPVFIGLLLMLTSSSAELFLKSRLDMLLLPVFNDEIIPKKLFDQKHKREIDKWSFLSKDGTKAKAEYAEEDESEVDSFRAEIIFVKQEGSEKETD